MSLPIPVVPQSLGKIWIENASGIDLQLQNYFDIPTFTRASEYDTIELPGRDGLVLTREQYGTTVTGLINGMMLRDTETNLRTDLNSLAMHITDNPCKLKFDNAADERYLLVRFTPMRHSGVRHNTWARVALNFEAIDPFWYKGTVDTGPATTALRGGAEMTQSITYNGAVPTEFDEIRWTGVLNGSNTANVKITHNGTSRFIEVLDTIVESKDLVIKQLDQTVDNDGTNAYSNVNAEFKRIPLQLQPGSNSFTFTVGGGGHADILLTWRDRFMV